MDFQDWLLAISAFSLGGMLFLATYCGLAIRRLNRENSDLEAKLACERRFREVFANSYTIHDFFARLHREFLDACAQQEFARNQLRDCPMEHREGFRTHLNYHDGRVNAHKEKRRQVISDMVALGMEGSIPDWVQPKKPAA